MQAAIPLQPTIPSTPEDLNVPFRTSHLASAHTRNMKWSFLTLFALLGQIQSKPLDRRPMAEERALVDLDLLEARSLEPRAVTNIVAGTPYTPSGTTRFGVTNQVEQFTVPFTGLWQIVLEAGAGGSGGNETTFTAGGGARLSGIFKLIQGVQYSYVVGARGGRGGGTPERSAGGGGGMSVVFLGSETLIVAGGGGGNSADGVNRGGNATAPAVSSGPSNGGNANAGAGGAGAGFTGNGANAGVVQGAKGGQSSTGSPAFAGGAVDSRQTGAQGKGGFGGGGGGGKYSGGGGGGYQGGDGGLIPGNLARPKSAGAAGTNFRAATYNGRAVTGTQALSNYGSDGYVAVVQTENSPIILIPV